MTIFLLLSAIPYDQGEAIEVVSHEVVRLMAAAGHRVHVQVLIRERRSASAGARETWARDYFAGAPAVTILPVLFLGEMMPTRSRGAELAARTAAMVRSLPRLCNIVNPYLFPAVAAKRAVAARVRAAAADVIVSIWSWEALAASYDIPGVPKFVYYGNPDHKPPAARLGAPELFDINTRGALGRLRFKLLERMNVARERQHLRMMAACETTVNNAKVDADYYADHGHPHSIYLQNMWPDADGGPVFGGRPAADARAHICGSVGNLGATGNTFGLFCLGAEIAPRLEARLGDGTFVIDVFGGGTPRPMVADALRRPSIVRRGWVEDINTEIVQSRVFLVLTNVRGFNVGNTRILLAWSLGACVIAHRASALSMPEMVHGENALLGDTPDEIADLIVQALEDPALQERIGRGGYATFQQHYRSAQVVPRLLDEIGRTVETFSRRASQEHM